ncbi:hypothetical protein ACU8KH_00762 [Lachancea thermotolerans]
MPHCQLENTFLLPPGAVHAPFLNSHRTLAAENYATRATVYVKVTRPQYALSTNS